MKTKIKVLFSFFVLFVASSLGQKGDQTRRSLAQLRRSAKRASDALDLLNSESSCDRKTDLHGRSEAGKTIASVDCPDWLIDYFRNQREGKIDRR